MVKAWAQNSPVSAKHCAKRLSTVFLFSPSAARFNRSSRPQFGHSAFMTPGRSGTLLVRATTSRHRAQALKALANRFFCFLAPDLFNIEASRLGRTRDQESPQRGRH